MATTYLHDQLLFKAKRVALIVTRVKRSSSIKQVETVATQVVSVTTVRLSILQIRSEQFLTWRSVFPILGSVLPFCIVTYLG